MVYLQNAAAFLLTTVFGFGIGLFLVRLLLVAVAAPFHPLICRVVYQLTNPLIDPLRAVVPRWRRLELAALLVAWGLAALEFAALLAIRGGRVGMATLLAIAGVETLDWLILIELVALLVYCLLSFAPNLQYHDEVRLLARVVEPVLRPFRRRLPAFAGLDLSPAFASLALILARLLLIAPLADWAARLG
jgi:YggT family protein